MAGFTRLHLTAVLVAAMAAACMTSAVRAQESSDELAKQLSNPVSSLISVPFQFNAAFGGGADDDGQWYTLNIQPVIPISIAPDWNLIVRTIVPIMGREDVVAPNSSEWGFGNTLQSFFFSPKAPTAGGIIWGLGPAFNYPTTTDPLFGPSEWGAGPTGVVLLQKGPVTDGPPVEPGLVVRGQQRARRHQQHVPPAVLRLFARQGTDASTPTSRPPTAGTPTSGTRR